MTLGRDPKYLGAELGCRVILHTWGQNLQLHPHLHCVIPGGGLSLDGERWIRSRNGFFLPVRVLSHLFRGKFLARLRGAFDEDQLDFRGEAAATGSCRARDPLDDARQQLGLGLQHPVAELGDSAIGPSFLAAVMHRRIDRLQQAALDEPVEDTIEICGPYLHRAVGVPVDSANDPIAVDRPVLEHGENEKLDGLQGELGPDRFLHSPGIPVRKVRITQIAHNSGSRARAQVAPEHNCKNGPPPCCYNHAV